jgi:SAM-dependent methyltransferase
VLEIGGGFGYQASIIASWGCKIISLDVNPKSSYFPIQHYDGVSIPFGDGSFDIVFSSNTLEHVNQLNALTAETRRVMRADGVGIHSLPSPIWRFWSNLGHYINLSRKLMSGEYGASYALRRELIPRRHGEKGNALSELHYFSRSYWKHIFEENGFKVIRIEPDRLFYTSPALFPNASLKLGVTSAKLFGSSCNTFFLKRKND